MSPRATARQASTGTTYVYILQSMKHEDRFCIGVTEDLRAHLKKHNADEVSHTAKYLPRRIKTCIAFGNKNQAFALERYLKLPSGRTFAKKRL